MIDLITVIYILPELILAIAAIILVLLGSILKKKSFYGFFAAGTLILASFLVYEPNQPLMLLNGLALASSYVCVGKLVVLTATLGVIIISIGYKNDFSKDYEYYTLMLLATIGALVMISSADFLSLYVGIELLSLPIYALVAFNKKNIWSSEGGLKYFILGILASVILLYGVSLVYGFTGTTNFLVLKSMYSSGNVMSIAAGIGMVLILCGLFFKIAAVPFYMWAPDVYQGAPLPVTAFLSTTPKAATIFVLIKMLFGYFSWAASIWQPILLFVSCASLIIGAVGALLQTDIKRLLAYSSIGHIGFILIGIATMNGVNASLFYLFVYLSMNLGIFAIISLLQEPQKENYEISVFRGLAKTSPILAFATSVLLLSMAGIPPLAGFLVKFEVITASIFNDHYLAVIIAMLSAVISAFYYLKIIKIMYFNNVEAQLSDRSFSIGNAFIALVAVVLNSSLMFFPTVLESWIASAIRSLLG